MLNSFTPDATDTGTFITTHKPGGVTTSEGQGIISTADGEIATYTAQGLGSTNETGYTTYRGIQIFAINSIGKMAFMDNLVGLYVYENDAEDRISGKIWEYHRYIIIYLQKDLTIFLPIAFVTFWTLGYFSKLDDSLKLGTKPNSLVMFSWFKNSQ